MTNSTLVYPVKMEYVYKINIFGLKMMVKSGLENSPWATHFLLIHFTSFLHKITNSLLKMNLFAHGGILIKKVL